MSQVCNICKIDKPVEDYYLTDGVKLWKRCKACISAAKPKEPKLTGWQLLPKDTQDAIRTALGDRHRKIKNIADEFGVNYANLTYWIRQKHV